MFELKGDENCCKYCMAPIPAGQYVCRSCWSDFEEDFGSDDDEDRDEDDEG